jgi:magnesium transporter
MVDNYFVILESLSLELEEYELQLLQMDSDFDIKSVYETKMNLFYQRKLAWPLREISNGLLRNENPLIKASTKVFFQDLYDHSIQIVETTETLRDVVLGITELYMSTVSNRTNEIMQTLTIIATIFIPLTFIVGVYGMNFEYMPELKWYWGYPAVWGLMIVSAFIMLLYFKKKKWF